MNFSFVVFSVVLTATANQLALLPQFYDLSQQLPLCLPCAFLTFPSYNITSTAQVSAIHIGNRYFCLFRFYCREVLAE